MRDTVYQHYVLPGYQQAEQRAEQMEALLIQEKQRAEQAEQQAAKFAARLKELVVSPDELA